MLLDYLKLTIVLIRPPFAKIDSKAALQRVVTSTVLDIFFTITLPTTKCTPSPPRPASDIPLNYTMTTIMSNRSQFFSLQV